MYVCLCAGTTDFSSHVPDIDWGNIPGERDHSGRLDDCRELEREINKQTPTATQDGEHPPTQVFTANSSTTRASTDGPLMRHLPQNPVLRWTSGYSASYQGV